MFDEKKKNLRFPNNYSQWNFYKILNRTFNYESKKKRFSREKRKLCKTKFIHYNFKSPYFGFNSHWILFLTYFKSVHFVTHLKYDIFSDILKIHSSWETSLSIILFLKYFIGTLAAAQDCMINYFLYSNANVKCSIYCRNILLKMLLEKIFQTCYQLAELYF